MIVNSRMHFWPWWVWVLFQNGLMKQKRSEEFHKIFITVYQINFEIGQKHKMQRKLLVLHIVFHLTCLCLYTKYVVPIISYSIIKRIKFSFNWSWNYLFYIVVDCCDLHAFITAHDTFLYCILSMIRVWPCVMSIKTIGTVFEIDMYVCTVAEVILNTHELRRWMTGNVHRLCWPY